MARKLILALLVMLVAQGCISYKFNGASIDYNKYKTVSFANFPIRAALVYPPLQQVFQNKLQDVVTQQTRLQQVYNPNSNLRFEGEITNYSLSPQAVGDNAYATRTRLTISVRVHYIDNINEALSNDINVSAYRDFDANQLLIDVQDQLCEEISAELVDLIFNQTLGNW
jgi:hypothetical protein